LPANTLYTGSGVNTLAGLASAINTAKMGVTATVVTSQGQSSLTLASQTATSAGALSVNSSIAATSDAALTYTEGSGFTSTTADGGILTAIANATDALSGSIKIQMGNGTTQTISVPPNSATSPSNTLAGLAGAINAANIGVTASLNTAVIGTNAIGTLLTLTSGTVGSAGALTVTSSLLDTTNTKTATLGYTSSSDISNLTSLGISVNNDGSFTFDAAALDSALNSDYSGVVGFFQGANSWGQTFSTMLTNAGTSSPTGILSLASSSNSNIESTLNADVSKEQIYISAQQVSLTAELNSANEIMQQLPSQLQGVNELYSAITGYNQNPGG
jgi:flagellar hook-associated protein 2